MRFNTSIHQLIVPLETATTTQPIVPQQNSTMNIPSSNVE